jgi:chorismate mutase/prephenate dehydratase
MNQPQKIAYLGPAATYSHEAALKQFGPDAEYLPMRSIPDVFYATGRREVDFGIVPVENALEGSVTFTLDMFARPDPEIANLTISAELYLPIITNLLTGPEGPKTLSEIELVYTHPQPLGQSRVWLQQNLPHVEFQETSSTVRAAEQALHNPKAAAISNRLTAELYGLRILAPAIQDADFNQTRFLVIGYRPYAHQPNQAGEETTAVMLSIKDRVGALHAITSIFVKYGLNMNRIESRPSKQKAWDYFFFIDFNGLPSQPNIAAALEELNNETSWVKVLGSWLRGQ